MNILLYFLSALIKVVCFTTDINTFAISLNLCKKKFKLCLNIPFLDSFPSQMKLLTLTFMDSCYKHKLTYSLEFSAVCFRGTSHAVRFNTAFSVRDVPNLQHKFI